MIKIWILVAVFQNPFGADAVKEVASFETKKECEQEAWQYMGGVCSVKYIQKPKETL